MSQVSLLVQLTRAQQIEIEEHCLTVGLTFSEYFSMLHNEAMLDKKICKSVPLNSPQDIKCFLEEHCYPLQEKEDEASSKITPLASDDSPKKKRGRPSKKS